MTCHNPRQHKKVVPCKVLVNQIDIFMTLLSCSGTVFVSNVVVNGDTSNTLMSVWCEYLLTCVKRPGGNPRYKLVNKGSSHIHHNCNWPIYGMRSVWNKGSSNEFHTELTINSLSHIPSIASVLRCQWPRLCRLQIEAELISNCTRNTASRLACESLFRCRVKFEKIVLTKSRVTPCKLDGISLHVLVMY